MPMDMRLSVLILAPTEGESIENIIKQIDAVLSLNSIKVLLDLTGHTPLVAELFQELDIFLSRQGITWQSNVFAFVYKKRRVTIPESLRRFQKNSIARALYEFGVPIY